MSGQAVQIGEQGEAIEAILAERLFQRSTQAIGNDDLLHIV